MKTVAFTGQYDVMTKILDKYCATKSSYYDSLNRTLENDEQIKIIKSKNPWGPVDNKYQWTSAASAIFVCVNANSKDFYQQYIDEVNIGRFAPDIQTVLVAHVDNLSDSKKEECLNLALEYNAAIVLCSINSDEAYYALPDSLVENKFATIFDNAISNIIQSENNAQNRHKMSQ